MKIVCKNRDVSRFTKGKTYVTYEIYSDGVIVKNDTSKLTRISNSFVHEHFTILADEYNENNKHNITNYMYAKKLICNTDRLSFLTKGKEYEVKSIIDSHYILDDKGRSITVRSKYVSSFFTPIIDEPNVKEPELCSVMVSIKRLKEKYCTKCGTSYEPEHKFCSQCGNERK
jgi:hypothetical protein